MTLQISPVLSQLIEILPMGSKVIKTKYGIEIVGKDADGNYKIDEWGVDVQGNHIAWLEERSHFSVKGVISGDLVVHWNVKCHNPAFGVIPYMLKWFSNNLVFVYREKHRIFAALLTSAGCEKLVPMDEIGIYKEFIAYVDWDLMGTKYSKIRIINLPSLGSVDEISLHDAQQKGIQVDVDGSINAYE